MADENDQENIEQEIDHLDHQFDRNKYGQWDQVQQWSQEDRDNFAPFGTENELAIQGPPAMHQIWPYDSTFIGQEWKVPIHEPLRDDQIARCQSELICDVTFGNRLGSGCFGTVWEAWAKYRPNELGNWLTLGFAVKVIRHGMITQTAITESLNDMFILQHLRHENISNIADCVGIPDSQTGFPYSVVCLFLEYCHGTFNDIYLQGKPPNLYESEWALPERLSKHWFAQIMRGLEYLHRNNVAHHDIKRHNVLYRYREDPVSTVFQDRFLSATFKLADFGISGYYQETEERLSEYKEADISEAFDILITSGIPSNDNSGKVDFIKYCVSNEWQQHYPVFWKFLCGRNFKNLIVDLYLEDILPGLGMSNLSGTSGIEKEKMFLIFCMTGVWKNKYPKEWKKVSANVREIFTKLSQTRPSFHPIPKGLTALQILNYEWFQRNDEPSTEPFILRDPFIPIQFDPQLYKDWENQAANEEPEPNYTPFGSAPTSRHRVWDEENFEWPINIPIQPIQGVANENEHNMAVQKLPEGPPEEPPEAPQNDPFKDLWQMLQTKKA